jgi:Uncharacterized protein conserved in bacteria
MTLSSLAVLPEADRLFDRPVAYEVSQFAPIARVLADPTLLACRLGAWKTLQEFVDDAKKRPGQIPYGSSGPYGTLHVRWKCCRQRRHQIAARAVPRRRSRADGMLSGTVQALASAPGTLKQQVDDGKMRVLANWGAGAAQEFSRPADLQGARLQGCRVLHLGRIVRAKCVAGADHDATARSDGASGEGAGGGQDLRDRRQPGRLSGRAGIFKFVAEDSARLVAAVKKIGKVE